jgi:hypothetical protein
MVQTPAELQPIYAGVTPVADDSKGRLGRDYLRTLAEVSVGARFFHEQ